jgi:hypothetical protein
MVPRQLYMKVTYKFPRSLWFMVQRQLYVKVKARDLHVHRRAKNKASLLITDVH